jgi:hypothetical protein
MSQNFSMCGGGGLEEGDVVDFVDLLPQVNQINNVPLPAHNIDAMLIVSHLLFFGNP